MKAPEFYAEWIPILRDFAVRKDDDEVITAMKNGCIPCSPTPPTRLAIAWKKQKQCGIRILWKILKGIRLRHIMKRG